MAHVTSGCEGENSLVATAVEGEGPKAKQEQGEGGGFGNGYNLPGHTTVGSHGAGVKVVANNSRSPAHCDARRAWIGSENRGV